MSEFIEPFLEDLSKFLSEEERNKLPKPWNENEKGEKKASDEGRISLRFVREINPEDYFGAKKQEEKYGVAGTVAEWYNPNDTSIKWFDSGVPQFITPLNVFGMETLGIVTEVEQEETQ